jgi:hypothetical protein
VRWGCEYVDVEVVWDPSVERRLAAMCGNTQLVASWPGSPGTHTRWDGPEMREIYERAACVGDIVRLVNTAGGSEGSAQAQLLAESLPPCIRPCSCSTPPPAGSRGPSTRSRTPRCPETRALAG